MPHLLHLLMVKFHKVKIVHRVLDHYKVLRHERNYKLLADDCFLFPSPTCC